MYVYDIESLHKPNLNTGLVYFIPIVFFPVIKRSIAYIFTKCKNGLKKCRAGEPEPGVFGSLEPEPEPLEKKRRAGAAWQKVRSRARAGKN